MNTCLLVKNVDSLNGEEIEYPEEDGPYTVYIGGSIGAWAHSEDIDFDSHILPFWYLNDSQCLCYKFRMFSLFYVNGSLQKIKYPALICLYGFKGFVPPFWLLNLKFDFFSSPKSCQYIRASSSKVYVPITLVLRKSEGPSMERST